MKLNINLLCMLFCFPQLGLQMSLIQTSFHNNHNHVFQVYPVNVTMLLYILLGLVTYQVDVDFWMTKSFISCGISQR